MGKGLEKLTAEELQSLKSKNIFNEQQIIQHLKRYSKYDSTKKATAGISAQDIAMFPEFSGHPFIERILELYVNDNGRIFPGGFVSMCAELSSVADINTKTNLAFRCFDIGQTGVLRYEAVFNMYKMMFTSGSLTEDQILDLTFRALNLPMLHQRGEITKRDFTNIVSTGEIKNKFTIDLQPV